MTTKHKDVTERLTTINPSLARQVRIDRSTLYKIMGGRRLPTEAQLQNLLSVLHATPAEYTALTHLYAHSQQTGAAAHRQQLLQALLSSAFRAQRIIREANSLPESGGTPLSAPAFLQGEELRTFLPQRLRQYLLSGDARPLMLSPRLNQTVGRAMVTAFASGISAPKPVWQLFQFLEDGSETALDENIKALTEITPLLLLPGIRYEGRLCYAPAAVPLPGLPMPVYLLFPDLCLFMDEAAHSAICIRDPAAVEFVRLQYSRQYLRAPHPLFLQAQYHSAEESMARTQTLSSASGPAFWLRDQPPLVGCLDRATMLSALLPGAPSGTSPLWRPTAILPKTVCSAFCVLDASTMFRPTFMSLCPWKPGWRCCARCASNAPGATAFCGCSTAALWRPRPGSQWISIPGTAYFSASMMKRGRTTGTAFCVSALLPTRCSPT